MGVLVTAMEVVDESNDAGQLVPMVQQKLDVLEVSGQMPRPTLVVTLAKTFRTSVGRVNRWSCSTWPVLQTTRTAGESPPKICG